MKTSGLAERGQTLKFTRMWKLVGVRSRCECLTFPASEIVTDVRDDELIVESPMEADRDALNVMAGHSYFLRDGILERQVMVNACKCGKPETHDKRVRSVLQLSSLLEDGTLILLPHPLMSQLGWYVVITGSEGRDMVPRVVSLHKVVRSLNKHHADSQPKPPEAGK